MHISLSPGKQPNEAAIVPFRQKLNVDGMVAAWLSSIRYHNGSRDETGELTGSPKTMKAYEETVDEFRAALQVQGLDLDSAQVDEDRGLDELSAIALIAQEFAGWSKRGKAVAASTYNQRLAIVSSFYAYTIRQRWLKANPILSVRRAKVQPYRGTKSIDREAIKAALAAINRKTLPGARDYALLSCLLQTGRRVSEMASLRWRHISIERRTQVITLDFEHCKGGKQMWDELPASVSRVLMAWLFSLYGMELGNLKPDAPIWVALARNPAFYGKAMTSQAMADVSQKHFGFSNIHRLRGAFAQAMEDVGAKPSEIQARLGHESLATTGIYLASLKRAQNKHADAVASLFGIE